MDHKTKMLDALEAAKWATTDTMRRNFLLEAQVHATAHAAEQQRIANLIALSRDDDMVDPNKGTWQDGFWEESRKVIVEGLGLA